MIPSRRQWKKWSLTSKYTAIGLYLSIISLVITLVVLGLERVKSSEEQKTYLIEKVRLYAEWDKQNHELVNQYELRLLELERQNYERLYIETKQTLETQKILTEEIRADKLRAEEQLEILKIELENSNNLVRRLFKFLLRITSENFRSREHYNNEIMKLLPKLKNDFAQSLDKIKEFESEYLTIKLDSLGSKIEMIGEHAIHTIVDSTGDHQARLDSLSKQSSNLFQKLLKLFKKD